MTAITQLREVIDASLDDDNYMASDPAFMATHMLEEARRIGRMAMEMADEIASDESISAAEASLQSAMLAEETANAARRLDTRLAVVRTLASVD